MVEQIINNSFLLENINYSRFLSPVQEKICFHAKTVKEICYGLAGVDILVLILILFGINFLSMFFWKNLKNKSIGLFGREIGLLYFLPLINGCFLIYMFAITYNIF